MKEYSRRNFLEILLFILVINSLVFLAVSLLHELGHAVLGTLSGCQGISVILDVQQISFYTMMECQAQISSLAVFWSSYILILPLSLAFLLLEDFKVTYLGYIMLGGNIMGSVADAAVYSDAAILRYFLIIVGLALIIVGEDRMIETTVQQRTPSSLETVKEDKKTQDEETARDDGSDTGDTDTGDDGGRDSDSDSGTDSPDEAATDG